MVRIRSAVRFRASAQTRLKKCIYEHTMRRKNKKNTKVIFTVIVLALLVFGYFIFSGLDKEKSINIKDGTEIEEKEKTITEPEKPAEENLIEEESTDSDTEVVEDESVDVPEGLAKSAIISYIDKNINDLAPESPSIGVWKVSRFWFTSDTDAYVEYSSNGELRQILVKIEGEADNLTYNRVAYFKSGESSWVLEQGEDEQFGKSRELYEGSDDQWIKKN